MKKVITVQRILAMDLLISILSLVFSSCDIFSSNISYFYRYDNADRYTPIGEGSYPASDIALLDIDWLDGELVLETYSGTDIEFKEDCAESLGEDERMHIYQDGKNLSIKYMASGLSKAPKAKKLVVRIPESHMLSELSLDSVSADVSLSGISAAELDAETVSGKILLERTRLYKDVDINTVSGNISASLLGKIYDISVESVSGAVSLSFENAPDHLDAESVSGNVEISLPEDSGFSLKFESVSGDLDSDIELSADGGKYLCGNASSRFDIETVSGNLDIKKQ